MKRWAVITVGLYLATLLLLTVPIYVACAWGQPEKLNEVVILMRSWGYWVWIAVSVASQALLLIVPVAAAEKRPQPKRPVLMSVVIATFLLSFLSMSALGCLAVVIWKEQGFMIFSLLNKTNSLGDTSKTVCAFFVYLVVVWTIWATVFYRFFRTTEPELVVRRLLRWLLKGSTLELLIAVPSHIIVRHRDDCCAPLMTAWGIAAGLTIMLLAFGPGVFFLFVERIRRLQPNGG